MKRIKEKNIHQFNSDVNKTGKYLYTDFRKYSAYIATKRQSDALIEMIDQYIGNVNTMLDVGCGDGTFTFELFERVKPKSLVGFDFALSAVKSANKQVKLKDKKRLVFKQCDVYDVKRVFGKKKFDLIIVRGLLHHLYEPEKAIKSLSWLSKRIIVLEPNGYNPILKIIEKVSSYHKRHEEKSYWPPLLNRWFVQNGFEVEDQHFFSIVPYFCPTPVAKVLKLIEPVMEKIPYIKKFYCGTNLVYYKRD